MRQPRIIADWSSVPLIFDLPYASRLLGQSVESLKKKAQRGELPGAFKCGSQWRVGKDTLKGYIERAAVDL